MLLARTGRATALILAPSGGRCSQELTPLDIVYTFKDGRFSGEAVVLLTTPAQVEHAKGKNKGYLGHRYIEVFAATKQVSVSEPANEATVVLLPWEPGLWRRLWRWVGASRRFDCGASCTGG